MKWINTYLKTYDDVDLILINDEVRDIVYDMGHYAFITYEWVLIIHAGKATNGHSKNSQHYKGKAIDFHWVDKTGKVVPLFAQEKVADLFPWIGKGSYPGWNSPGLHRDLRKRRKYNEGYSWIKFGDNYEDPVELILEGRM